MVHIGQKHNSTTSLPVKRNENGRVLIDASVSEIRENVQSVMHDQIRIAKQAEELGFESIFFSEHHLHTAGQEVSSNPLQVQTAIAAQTEDIKLGQSACILPWYDPLRFAEQAALLDVISDGRAEIGIGRGYQPREAQTMGQYWGGGVQDQEQNRASYEEKYDIVTEAWTEDTFSYAGEYHSVPPKATMWHSEHERAYYESDVSGIDADRVIDWNEDRMKTTNGVNQIVSGGSTLSEVTVHPKPAQSPHPQLWQPAFSPRSVAFAAERGINAFIIGLPNDKLQEITGLYYKTAEEAGWPDHRPEYDGEPFDYGWDEGRNRGVAVTRYVMNTDVATEEEIEQWRLGLVNQWQYYADFGLLGALADLEYEEAVELLKKHGADLFIDQGVALVGDSDYIADAIAEMVEYCGFDDLNFQPEFEVTGSTAEFINKQQEAFATEVAPYLREQFPSSDSP